RADDGTSANHLSNIATVLLTISNEAPFAIADNYSGPQGSTTLGSLPVLVNDPDLDNDRLTGTLVSGAANAQSFTFFGTTPVAGTFYYNPGNYIGPDTFTYLASDGMLNSYDAIAGLTFYPTNNPDVPIAMGGGEGWVTHDHTFSVAAPGVLGDSSTA